MIRQELLGQSKKFLDLGDIRVIPHLLHDKYLNQKTLNACRRALYGKQDKLPVSPLSMAEKVLTDLYKKFPQAKILGLGGDHSTSYPLVLAWLASRKKLKEAGLLHFDAHTDLLDKRLGIDLCFGTWTFAILDELYSRNHILQIGIRSSGKSKQHWKKTLGVEQIWAKEANKEGVEKTYGRIKNHFIKIGVKEIYISFDIDALDEKYAAATGTPEKEGLLPSDCAAIIRLLSKDFKISGADLMEVAPYVLPEGVEVRDQQSSLIVAGDIAGILLDVLKP
jgi:agmatinase